MIAILSSKFYMIWCVGSLRRTIVLRLVRHGYSNEGKTRLLILVSNVISTVVIDFVVGLIQID